MLITYSASNIIIITITLSSNSNIKTKLVMKFYIGQIFAVISYTCIYT